jgi:EAL domain-containing protein (putative c-di-GMP-specific phosphodiesterase class I)
LKIDQSFVRGIPGETQAARMTEAIMAIARAMGVKLIAEGIETEQQLDYLRDAGCAEGQGYYFSRPLGEAELDAMLREERVMAARAASAPTLLVA